MTDEDLNLGYIKVPIKRTDDGFGFSIIGGLDYPFFPNDPGIFIANIKPGTPAFESGLLKGGDRILELNGESMTNKTHAMAVQMFLNAGENIILLMERDSQSPEVKKFKDLFPEMNSFCDSSAEFEPWQFEVFIIQYGGRLALLTVLGFGSYGLWKMRHFMLHYVYIAANKIIEYCRDNTQIHHLVKMKERIQKKNHIADEKK